MKNMKSKLTTTNIHLREHGFSLLEVLIGITLLALLMLGVYSIIDNNTRSRDKITAEDRRIVELEMALSRIDTDFSQVYTPAYFSARKIKIENPNEPYPTNQTEETFVPDENFAYMTESGLPAIKFSSPDKSSFILFTFSNKRKFEDDKESNFQWIKYSFTDKVPDGMSINRHPDAPFFLERRAINENIYSSNLDFEKSRPQILIKNIKSAEINYYDKVRKKYVSNIEELGEERFKPLGMKLTVHWLDANNFEQTSERVYRVYWPSFDSEVEQREIRSIEAQNKLAAKSSTTAPGAPESPDTQPPADPENQDSL